MSITTIFLYLICSIILFIIFEILNYKKVSKINNIIITLIYLIIISGIYPNICDNIFMIPILELLLRAVVNTYILERNFFKEHTKEIKIYLISIICSYIMNILFINKVNNVIPNAEQLKIIIWLLIASYLSKLIKNNLESTFKIDNSNKEIFTNEYTVIEYAKLKNKYSNDINTKIKSLIPIIYSIMIYENYYKSSFIRKIDELYFKLNNKDTKFGIMQVKSNTIIDDITSIKLTIKELEKIINNKKTKNEDIKTIIKEYINNDKKSAEIINIYNKIIEFDKK
jgi:hypothetical protein